MIRHMVQRSLPFVLLAGLMSCKGDPTDSLRNGVDQLLADPSQIILDSASTQSVIVSALDEQGNQVSAKFSATATGGVSVVFDTTYNRVYDTEGNLKPQNPATHVRYIVSGNAVGNASVTVNAGGKSVTIPVRVPPASLPATISNGTPNAGDTITIALPAPATFNFTAGDTSTIGVTIGGNACRIVSVTAGNSTVGCVPLPGSTGRPSLRGVLPGVGGIGAITVLTDGSVTLPLPALTFTPANPAIGDTVKIVAPAPYKFGDGTGTASDTSVVAVAAGSIVRTIRTADSIKFLVGAGLNSIASVSRLRIPNFQGESNIFTASTGAAVTTPAAPVLVTTPGGSVAIGSTVTVVASGRYRFSPAASTTVTMPSTLTGFNAGAQVISVSADSLTLTYAIGPNVSGGTATIGGVRISGAAALGTFSLTTDKTFTTPALAQIPATFADSTPASGATATVFVGAGYKFTPTTAVQFSGQSALVTARAADSSSITFLPIPGVPRQKPTFTNIVATAAPAVRFPTRGAVYLTTPADLALAVGTAPTITIPATNNTFSLVSYGNFTANDNFCAGLTFGGTKCRYNKFSIATDRDFHVDITQPTGSFDLGVYFIDQHTLDIVDACDNLGATANGEHCDIAGLPAGDYFALSVNYSSANPSTFTVLYTGQ